jgi:hypothetical protein
MNKYPLYLFLVLLALLTGCLKEQEVLFSEPAAVRLNNTIAGIDSSLTQAPNGWLMQYFATDESAGYSMIISFNANGEVVIATKNELVKNIYTEDRSIYNVIGDNGPIITFNTYNNVLHLFSNPENPDGTGLNGDYEFIVIDYSDSLIHLKGKKRGTDILMQKLPGGISWIDYFDELDRMDNEIVGAEPLYFVSGTDTFTVYNGASHIFELQTLGAGDAASIPFIITSDGLRFYSPYTTTKNKKVQSFYLSDDGNKLISNEDNNTFFFGTDISLYFESSQETYSFDTTQMSDHYKNPIRDLCLQMKEKYGGRRNIDFLALSYKTGIGHSFNLVTEPTITIANFGIELLSDNSSNNQMRINKLDGVFDSNGALFYSNIPAIEEIWQELSGIYHLTSTVSRNQVKFVDKDDATRFFVVIRR